MSLLGHGSLRGVTVIFGQLGFYFDGETIYLRILIPQHGMTGAKSWDQHKLDAYKRKREWRARQRSA